MTQVALDFEHRPHDEQLNIEIQVLRDRKEKREITSEEHRALFRKAVFDSLERMIKRYAQ